MPSRSPGGILTDSIKMLRVPGRQILQRVKGTSKGGQRTSGQDRVLQNPGKMQDKIPKGPKRKKGNLAQRPDSPAKEDRMWDCIRRKKRSERHFTLGSHLPVRGVPGLGPPVPHR